MNLLSKQSLLNFILSVGGITPTLIEESKHKNNLGHLRNNKNYIYLVGMFILKQ